MPFEGFVNNIIHIPNSIKDIHFRAQYEYIRGIDNNVKYFRVEKDSKALKEYLNKFGLQLNNYNKNETEFNKSDYYTAALKKSVAKIYREDFQYFGYSTE